MTQEATPIDLTAFYPKEVVTQTHVRDVAMPGGAGTLALVTIDNGMDHTRPTTFGPAGVAGMRAAFEELRKRADAGEIQAVAVTGKPFIFAVGVRPVRRSQHDASATRARPWRASATTPTRCSWTFRSRPSRSSTARSWAAGSSWRSRCDYRTHLRWRASARLPGVLPWPGPRSGAGAG